MAPKKAAADSMVEDKPPDLQKSDKITGQSKPKRPGKRVATSRVKKPKPRLKPIHIVKVKVPQPKLKVVKPCEPSIEDPIDEKIISSTYNEASEPNTKPPLYPKKLMKADVKPPTKKKLKNADAKPPSYPKKLKKADPKPLSYPKKLNKADAIKFANEDTSSWARDISSSISGTTLLSNSSYKILNGKNLVVKLEKINISSKQKNKLKRDIQEKSVCSDKADGDTNVTHKRNTKRATPNRRIMSNEDIVQELTTPPTNKKAKIAPIEVSTTEQSPMKETNSGSKECPKQPKLLLSKCALTKRYKIRKEPDINKLGSTLSNRKLEVATEKQISIKETYLIPTENSVQIQSPRKSTRFKNKSKLPLSPPKRTVGSLSKSYVNLATNFDTRATNLCKNKKSPHRSLSSDRSPTRHKNTNSERVCTPELSSSSKITNDSSISIPISAISKSTTCKAGSDERRRILNLAMDSVSLDFLKFSEKIEKDKYIESLQNYTGEMSIEDEYLLLKKSKNWLPRPSKIQIKKSLVQNESTTRPLEIENDAFQDNNLVRADHGNVSDTVEDQMYLSNTVVDYMNLSEFDFEDDPLESNCVNPATDKFENNKEIDSFSDIVRQKSYEQRAHIDDEDDLLSLFAESMTSLITESSKGSIAVPYADKDKINREDIKKPFKIPKFTKSKEEAPKNLKQTKETKIIKNKTKIVCEKQNADSTSIDKEEQQNTLTVSHSIPETNIELNPRPVPFLQTCPSPVSPTTRWGVLFNGVCFLNLSGICKRYNCKYLHRKQPPSEIQRRLTYMDDEDIKAEYKYMFQYPKLRNLYISCFALVCIDRDLPFVLQIAIDSLEKGTHEHVKLEILETALIYLNDRHLDHLKIFLTDQLQDELMKALAEIQSFSRFKPIFINLTQYIVAQERKFNLNVSTQLFERIILLPYEFHTIKALIQMIENTDPLIMRNKEMPKLLEMLLYHRDIDLWERLTQMTHNTFKVPQIPVEATTLEFYDVDLGPEQFIQDCSCGTQNISGKLNIENRRYISPDTTHFDNLQNRSIATSPISTRMVDVNSRARMYVTGPSADSSPNISNRSTSTPPGQNVLAQPMYRNTHNRVWRRGNLTPRIPSLMRATFLPPTQHQFGTRGFNHHPASPVGTKSMPAREKSLKREPSWPAHNETVTAERADQDRQEDSEKKSEGGFFH